MQHDNRPGHARHLPLGAVCLLAAASLLMLTPLQADAKEPSYEDTLVFIEGNARYPLVENDRRCEFIYRDNFRFSARALNPVPVVNGWGALFKCTQARKCIDPRNSGTLQGEITIEAKDINKADKVARAVTHLIQLCGGAKAKPDLF
jgi:hypothetical protein